MIARDHRRAHTSGRHLRERFFHSCAGRVSKAENPDKLEVPFQFLERTARCLRVDRPGRHGDDAPSLRGFDFKFRTQRS